MINMFVARNKDLAYRVIDGEAIILSPEDGRLHNLNAVATRIFEVADGKTRLKDIPVLICEEFEVSEEVSRKDAIDFVEDLVHKKLLILSENPIKDVG